MSFGERDHIEGGLRIQTDIVVFVDCDCRPRTAFHIDSIAKRYRRIDGRFGPALIRLALLSAGLSSDSNVAIQLVEASSIRNDVRLNGVFLQPRSDRKSVV